MSGVSSRMAVVLFLTMFSLLACSSEQDGRPDTDEIPAESIRAAGGRFPTGGAEGEPVARTEGSVDVERAVPSSAGEADLVHARVEYGGAWVWPQCSLLEGPDVEAVRGIIGSRLPPKDEGFTRTLWEESLWAEHESPWADRGTIEKSLQDDGAVIWTFHEDPAQGGEAADPRRTPFFVRCVGGDPPDTVRDVAHVLGTTRGGISAVPSSREGREVRSARRRHGAQTRVPRSVDRSVRL